VTFSQVLSELRRELARRYVEDQDPRLELIDGPELTGRWGLLYGPSDGGIDVKSQVILAVAAALVSVPAFAQSEGQRSMASAFDALDANKDGNISRAEAQPSPIVSQSFATADANGDGVIAREEFNSSFTMRTPDSAPPSPVPPANPPPR